jgi:tetratricopeptide (TPR) repeat protein
MLMKKIFLLGLIAVFLFGCKSSKPTSSSAKPATKTALSNTQKADVTYLFFNANKEKILGNLNNAADMFAEVIRKDGSNHAAMYELANIYDAQKKYSDALFFSRSAYKLDPKNEWYAMSLSDILQKNHKFEESTQVLEQLTKDKPDRIDYYFEWASALVFGGKYSDAIKVYDKIEERIGVTGELTLQKERLWLQLNKNDKAIAEVQKLIDSNPKDAKAYNMLAELYQKLGNKEKALEVYNKILEIDPNNPYVHLSLANYYRSNGNNEKSQQELKLAFSNKELDVDTKISILVSYFPIVEEHPEMMEQALEMSKLLIEANPIEPRTHAIYGEFLIQNKEYEKARTAMRLALKNGSKEFAVIQRLLYLDSQLQDWDSMISESDSAMANFPDQPVTYLFNGIAKIQKKQYKQAVEVLNSGVKMVVDDKPLEENFYSSLGDAYQELKDFAKSDESYEKVLEINPKNATTLNNYAYYLSLRGEKLDKAEAMSKQSNEIQPAQASFEDTYGWIMYKMGKFKEAKIWIEKALSHGSDKSAAVLEHYGDILFKDGDIDKALEYWKKAKDAGDGASEFLDKKLSEKKVIE